MELELVKSLTSTFESFSHKTNQGIEFWLARDIQALLGYEKWDNFSNVVMKAKSACELSGHNIADHFADVGKTIKMPKGAEKTVPDTMLTRYACYLIAQNGDSRKEEIAFAQTYFAIQTRKLEIIEQRILESERVAARRKLADTEKELSGVIFEQTKSDKNFGIIRSKGDQALFNQSTKQMKLRWKVPKGRALADFAPTIILKAKDFATEITIFNAKSKQMSAEKEISNEHVTNNRGVRKILLERGIVPEKLSAEPDIKKVSRRIKSNIKKSLDNTDSLK